jgi:DNA-binding XRE family transcriptional regulator
MVENSTSGLELYIGIRIRELRKRVGLSITDLAKKVGISYQTMQKIETDKASPSVMLLAHIAQVLSYPI